MTGPWSTSELEFCYVLTSRLPQNKETLPPLLSREKLRSVDYLANTFHVNTSVSDILHLVKGRRCCDDHDYVYGVLGLLPVALQNIIIPSYERTTAETYTSFTISCLEQHKHLNILRCCGLEAKSQRHGLSSWVPDLSSTDKWTNPIKWHNAAGASEAVFELLGHGLLRVAGVECGAVSFTEEECAGSSGTRARRVLDFIGLTGPNRYPNCNKEGNIPLEVFGKTLAGGYLKDRFPDHTLPSVEKWKAAVVNLDYLQRLLAESSSDFQLQFHEQWVSGLLQKRVLFRTDTASIALGPPGVKQGQ